MKKFYCFNCQKDVKTINLLSWKICPHCFRKIKDNGDGFYLVCDKCGANNPVDGDYCVKCGQGINGNKGRIIITNETYNFFQKILKLILPIGILILFFWLVYISFYLFFIFVIIGSILFFINKIFNR